MFRVILFFVLTVSVSGCDKETRKLRTLEEVVKDAVHHELKKTDNKKASQDVEDQLSKIENLFIDLSSEKKESDERNFGGIRNLKNFWKIGLRHAKTEADVLRLLIYALFKVQANLGEEAEDFCFAKQSNLEQMVSVGLDFSLKVAVNLGSLSEVVRKLKGIGIRSQKMFQEHAGSNDNSSEEVKECHDDSAENLSNREFFLLQGQPESLSSLINLLHGTQTSLVANIHSFDNGISNGTDHRICLRNLYASVLRCLPELQKALDYLQDKLETGEPIFDPSKDLYQKFEEIDQNIRSDRSSTGVFVKNRDVIYWTEKCLDLLHKSPTPQVSPPKIFEEEISLQETSRWLCMKNSLEFSSEVDLL